MRDTSKIGTVPGVATWWDSETMRSQGGSGWEVNGTLE